MYINFDCDVHLQVRPPPVETAPTSWPGAQKASLCTVSVHNFCTESQRRAERKGRRGRERRERQRDRAHSDSHAQQTWCTLNKMARITSEIVVQIPLEEMGPGWGIVFEFVHYKPKEKKNSGAAANRPTAQSLCPSRSPPAPLARPPRARPRLAPSQVHVAASVRCWMLIEKEHIAAGEQQVQPLLS